MFEGIFECTNIGRQVKTQRMDPVTRNIQQLTFYCLDMRATTDPANDPVIDAVSGGKLEITSLTMASAGRFSPGKKFRVRIEEIE